MNPHGDRRFNTKRALFGTVLGFAIGPLLVGVIGGAFGFHGYELLGCVIGAPVGFLLGPRASQKTLVWTGIASMSMLAVLCLLFVLFFIAMPLIGIVVTMVSEVVPPWGALLIVMVSGALYGLVLGELIERGGQTGPRIRLGFLTATSIRRRVLVSGSLALVSLALFVLWCMTDGSVAIHKDYRPRYVEPVTPAKYEVCLYPSLQPRGNLVRKPGRFFKECVTFPGPHILYVSVRDYGRTLEGVQINACGIRTPDHRWEQSLEIGQEEGTVHRFHAVTETDKYAQAIFTARLAGKEAGTEGANIVLPADADSFVLEIQFDLMSGGQKESFQKSYTLLPAPNEYSSYGLNRAIAF